MARGRRFRFGGWRPAVAPAAPGAGGIYHVTIAGDAGGDVIVGTGNVKNTTIIQMPEPEKPVRVRVVGGRPDAAIALLERPELQARLAGTGPVVLSGPRGVGKSQLAARHSRLRDDEGWDVVVWLAAETEAGIIDGWAEAAQQLAAQDGAAPGGPVDPVQAAKAAIRWLDKQPVRPDGSPVRALVTFDNAIDVAAVRRWRPANHHVQVVVTTNRRVFAGLGELIEVDVFGATPAAAYLASRTGLDDTGGAALLAADLGHLPLALAQAGALIGHNRRYPTYDAYRARLSGVDLARMLPPTAGDPYLRGVAEATLITVAELAEADRGARVLLDMLALLSPDGVEIDLLVPMATGTASSWSSGGNPFSAASAAPSDGEPADILADRMQVLIDFSLASRSASESRVHVHRLTQQVVRDLARREGSFEFTAGMAATVLAASVSHDADAQWPHRAVLGNLGEQILTLHGHLAGMTGDVAALVARLLVWYAWHVLWTADAERKGQIAQFAYAETLRVLGPDDPDTVSAHYHLAQAYRALGLDMLAVDAMGAVVADVERIFGMGAPETLGARSSLADSYREAGDLDRAVSLLESTLDDMLRLLGPDEQLTVSARNSLAWAYHLAGQMEKALPQHEAALAAAERILGPDSGITLTARSSLALAYHDAGRTEDATTLLEAVLADQVRLFGPEHEGTMVACNSLAGVYQSAGRVDEAIECYLVAFGNALRLLGMGHPRTLEICSALAGALRDAGRLDDAIELYETLNAAIVGALGTEDADTFGVRTTLADAYREAGRTGEAITLYASILEAAIRVLGPDHELTASVRESLAAARNSPAHRIDGSR